MLILEIAIGIVLGYIILTLLPLVFTEAFWKIIGYIIGIVLIIVAFVVFIANIKVLAPLFVFGLLAFIIVLIGMEHEKEQRYSKIKFTINEQKCTVTVADQNNEVVTTYTGIRNYISAAQRFFEEKNLNLDDYSVRVLTKKGDTYGCIYTRKQKKQK